jgi:hypothetical protein
MRFYRYEAIQYAEHDYDGELVSPKYPNPKLELNVYELISETPHGYWIGYDLIKLKWISKTSKKKFAYPTKEEALTNFIKRNEKRIKILEYQIMYCKISLGHAMKLKD